MASNVTVNDCERVVALVSEVGFSSDIPRTLDIDSLDPIQDRLASVLDALASVLVHEARGM